MKTKFQHYLLASMAITSLTFTSCGGGEETVKKEENKDTVVADTTAVEPKDYGFEITEKEFPATIYVMKKGTAVKMEEIGKFFETNYDKIGKACGKSGHAISGSPVGIFWTWDDSLMVSDMAAAMPVTPKGEIAYKDLEKFEVPASKCLMIAYYGAYEKSENAHKAMGEYINDNGLAQDFVIEEYVTDPGAEPDTTKWLTNIYYILK